ncbi:MAG: hypothetical protein J5698_01185 [Bacteroidaceae bacterium]|nr:hypothetical protein [Bacteroidaceae bacterium]
MIKWFVDKESGHVSEARKEIRRRFSGVDWKYQKKILLASLASCETDRTWAYPKLLDCWEDSFAPVIEDLWNTYHEKRCSWVIIRFFPKEYIRTNMDSLLVDERNYYFICRRMADEKDFVIDPKLFWDVEDYFRAMAVCHKPASKNELLDAMYTVVHDLCNIDYERIEHGIIDARYAEAHGLSILDYERMAWRHFYDDSMAVWGREVFGPSSFRLIQRLEYSLEEMGAQEALQEFQTWSEQTEKVIVNSEEFKQLNEKVLTDNEYDNERKRIAKRISYECLPERYKNRTEHNMSTNKALAHDEIRLEEEKTWKSNNENFDDSDVGRDEIFIHPKRRRQKDIPEENVFLNERMGNGEQKTDEQIIEDLATAWRTLNPELLIQHLAPEFIYDSMWVFEHLEYSDYVNYLRAKFNTIRESGSVLVIEELPGKNAISINQDNQRTAYYVVKIQNGKIVKGDLTAFLPYGF